MTISQHDKAERFHALHRAEAPLVLANAWDVASARLVADAGATAVATTSAGVAWSLGAPDGDQLNRQLAIDLIARVAAAVELPVTADVESGFADTPDGVAETIRLVLDAGAIGVNIEDSTGPVLRPVDEQVARIAAARSAADAAGIPLYINARTDPFLRQVHDDPAERLRDAIDRAAAYVEAGADGIFVPGTTNLGVIGELSAAIDRPLNVLAGPGAPAVAELAAAGASRISIGAALAQAAYAVAQRGIREVLTTGGYESIADALDFRELNSLLQD
ncbi:2-Methylisocitrate lyase, PEP mutase family [Saccharopolyspora antimicrobica]|uniref:2-Methylisocitrate lyase, PEP mutase family n=1 Tax=Saccharopolyspora antimicrobica TaxID=455193 RepID=A0A1I4XB48_9PSEU|nr:isocitrate lyase/phosphoenolpyruvate mutase family protein [Saccharopolyspora antimicrobica]RKT84418.1 2-methylisocitrate lyase-like PEP mutase family enzyme [Saccharopolyspora antimicrobica]SFN23015.1 2-Methylisocitrate lyase, PEP mutase family [Saccharopolyspora antimicrobica]